MKTEKQNIEQTILEAAERLFLAQGFMKTTTAQIAREAGCNSAMVHYYYRTKEQLFERIYGEKIGLVIENLSSVSGSTGTPEERIDRLIDVYFDFLSRNPKLPAFLLYEARQSSAVSKHINNRLREALQGIVTPIDKDLQAAIAKGQIRPIAAVDLFMTVLTLCIGSFLIVPVFRDVWNLTDEQFADLMRRRREEIKETTLSRIKR